MIKIEVSQLRHLRVEAIAYMHFPGEDEDDKNNRYTLESHLHLEDIINLSGPNKIIEVEVGLLESLKNQTPADVLAPKVDKVLEEGLIAGELFLSIYLMEKFGQKHPSKRKAIDWLVHLASSVAIYSDGNPLNTSHSTFESYWDKYKNVIHLWAVWALDRNFPFALDGKDPFYIDHEPSSLGTAIKAWGYAKSFYDFGTNFIPYHRTLPLLDKAFLWPLPDNLESYPINCDKPEAMFNWLENYTHYK